jgi:hypothetical protein
MGSTAALIEVLARDGSVRQGVKVAAWPLRVGRALDNDLVLDDPHIAAHHFTIDADEGGVFVTVGDSLNGVQVDGHKKLAAGQRWRAAAAEPLRLTVGRMHLRLRLDTHPLAPEQPMWAAQALHHPVGSLVLLAGLALAVLTLQMYLEAEPTGLLRVMSDWLPRVLGYGFAWCAFWTVLSKVFAHQGHFGWHVRVLLAGLVAQQGLQAIALAVSFSLSWPWVSSYDFLLALGVLSAMLYFHLQAVEPHKPRLTFTLSASALTIAVSLTLWGNWRGAGRFGGELYMSHLLPPAMRVATPVGVDEFMPGVQALQTGLDEQAARVDADD